MDRRLEFFLGTRGRLAAATLLMLLAACGGSGGNTDPDAGAGGGGGIIPDGDGGARAPVGSACAEDLECAGPGTPQCIIEELVPLASLLGSPNEAAAALADQTRIPFPDNYCSTVGPCTSDDECGEGGTCFLPLVDVPEADFTSLVDALDISDDEKAIVAGFRTYGVCLDACETTADCTRAGYKCDVPLGDFVGLLEGAGARLETYCVGDPEAIAACAACDTNATCDDDETGTYSCTC
jgi:hypothetical protein